MEEREFEGRYILKMASSVLRVTVWMEVFTDGTGTLHQSSLLLDNGELDSVLIPESSVELTSAQVMRLVHGMEWQKPGPKDLWAKTTVVIP